MGKSFADHQRRHKRGGGEKEKVWKKGKKGMGTVKSARKKLPNPTSGEKKNRWNQGHVVPKSPHKTIGSGAGERCGEEGGKARSAPEINPKCRKG